MTQNNKPISAERFREAMGLVPGFVTVIASEVAGRRFGYTATAVCSLSAEPPQIIICASKEFGNHESIQECQRFSVNVLAEEQVDVSTRFSAQPEEGRFATGDWHIGKSGMPVLTDAVVTFECLVERQIDSSSHSIFIGLIVACETNPKSVLMYGERAYGRFSHFDLTDG